MASELPPFHRTRQAGLRVRAFEKARTYRRPATTKAEAATDHRNETSKNPTLYKG